MLQPENILLASKKDPTRLKLCDFGMSHRLKGMDCLKTICGSPGYMAPEIVKEVSGSFVESIETSSLSSRSSLKGRKEFMSLLQRFFRDGQLIFFFSF